MESEAASYIAMYKCKEELRSFYSCLKDNPGDDSICQNHYEEIGKCIWSNFNKQGVGIRENMNSFMDCSHSNSSGYSNI